MVFAKSIALSTIKHNTFMKSKRILVLFLLAFYAIGCNAVKQNKRAVIGAGAGIAVGGALGGILGNKAGNTAGGILIGAAVGGVAGGVIGKYMDKQKNDLEKDLGTVAKVERVGEGIQLKFDSGLLFAVNSDKLSPAAEMNLAKFSETLKKYPETYVLVDGHTDNTGADEYNQTLSVKRSESVARFLQSKNVVRKRLGTRGLGETQSVADNSTDAGKQQNRRVEVSIWANEKLKQDAQDGTLNQK